MSHGRNPPWLYDYPADAEPLPSRPSRGHTKPTTTAVVDVSTSDHTQTTPTLLPLPDEVTDAPLASGEDSEEEIDCDVGEPLDDDD